MPHPLLIQLRFTRSELKRALLGLNAADAGRRFLPMNCISWTLGHLAWQEQAYWLTGLQGHTPLPHLGTLVGSGQPACTPPLADMWQAWQTVTELVDPFLDTLTPDTLTTELFQGTGCPDDDEQQMRSTIGSLLLRLIYHYWYHIGEILAIRQLLGHSDLAEFVGDLDIQAPYLPEFPM